MAEQIESQSAGALDGQASGEGQLVVFRLANEEFGLNINSVKEIVRLPDITPIPRSPEYVAGICNLRGSVLPVIDTRMRFSMDSGETTDHTRLLVVESNGQHTGLIVDNMREVMRVNSTLLEPPPSVCRGVDKEFLSGVVKMNKGERLIMTLNLEEVIAIETSHGEETAGATAMRDQADGNEEKVEEEQLVSFKIAGEEYAFNIEKVREILKVTEVTEVPNVPDYVKGLFTIRNQLMPVLDLRGLLGITSLIAERQAMIDRGIEDNRAWVDNVRNAIIAGTHSAVTDPRKSSFGKWLDSYNTSSIEIEVVLKKLKRVRGDLFNSVFRLLESRENSRENLKSAFETEVEPHSRMLQDTLAEFRNAVEVFTSEDQRIMVVEADSMSIGYLVDCVDEVIRIPRSVIDETPLLASSSKRELRGVAKLNRGERLIMIMDESALTGRETARVLSDIRRGANSSVGDTAMQEKSLAQQSLGEEQLVTFTINKEEYGIRIMQVQEINRLAEITSVPRAPYFIDGVTNLRGNVVPVINIRELFGLEKREVDDRTRIMIVDIGGTKTGLRVDQVNEVLRLSKQDIERTPSIVTSGSANKYMDGVCKMDDGKRMVMLLDVEKILDEKEFQSMNSLCEEDARGQTLPRARSVADKRKSTKTKEKGIVH